MERIIDVDIMDIVPYSKGLIYVKREFLDDEKVKASFFSYDFILKESVPITKGVYFLNKFGPGFKAILEQLEDLITCETGIIPNEFTIVMYPTGEMGVFDNEGTLTWTGDLIYHDSPVKGITVDEKCIWCVVPNENSVVRYSPSQRKFLLRIGGSRSTSFANPVDIRLFDDKLYVCNYDACKIRTIDVHNYVVRDYLLFDEPVKKYFRIMGKEVVLLESGVYVL